MEFQFDLLIFFVLGGSLLLPMIGAIAGAKAGAGAEIVPRPPPQ